MEEKKTLRGNRKLVGFLDHVVHPASVSQFLFGPVKTLSFVRDPSGGGVASMVYRSGAIGSLHLAFGQSGTSPLERLEVVGDGANVIVDNGVKLTYHRRGERGPGGYGRSVDFIGPDAGAPIIWEPEWSLGQLYNKGLFLLGYYGEVAAFVECVQANRRPDVANLDDAREVMKVYEGFLGREGETVTLPA
jgi:predicted dehydrogenase